MTSKNPIKIFNITLCIAIIVLTVIMLAVWTSFKDIATIENSLMINKAAGITYDLKAVDMENGAFDPVRTGHKEEGTDILMIAMIVSIIVLTFSWLHDMRTVKRYVEQKKNDEIKLLESESRYRSLIENSPDGILVHDQKKYIFANTAALKILGAKDPREIIGKNIFERIHPDYYDIVKKRIEMEKDGKKLDLLEEKFMRMDGSPVDVEVAAFPFMRNGTIEVIGIIRDITQRKLAEEELRERSAQTALGSEVGTALARGDNLRNILQQCSQIIVKNLDAAFARIWTFSQKDNMLELQASAGMYTHINGPHSRIPVGKLKIGVIAKERKAILTNDLTGDPLISDHDWIKREGIVSFAGYPLIVEEKLVGVMAMFARRPLTDSILKSLASVADNIATGIKRKLAEEEIHRLNEELEQKISDRTGELNRKKDELMEANKKLMEIDRMKSMFIASTSHELRTPLNSIIGFSSILLDGWSGELNSEQKEHLQLIQDSGRHLLSLINDVIDISKVEAGKLEINYQEILLMDVVNDAIASIKHNLSEKDIELFVDVPDIILKTDRRRLLQCLLNLISNAVKYTEKGKIMIIAKNINGRLDILISDTGIGIKPGDIPKLFAPFVRLESPISAGIPGTGLGLYLTQKLTKEVLHGEVDVKSELGKGSTFTLHIPLKIEEKKENT